jgi:hypothetical protein
MLLLMMMMMLMLLVLRKMPRTSTAQRVGGLPC